MQPPPAATLETARRAAARGSPRRARRLILELRRDRPDDPELALALVEVEIALGRSAEALAVADALAEARPEDAATQLAHGRVLLRLGRLDAAGERLRRAATLDPSNAGAWRLLADLEAMRGRRDREAEVLAEGAASAREPVSLRLQLAERRLAGGDAAGAGAALAAIETDRLPARRLARLAELHRLSGDAATAEAVFARLPPTGPFGGARMLNEVLRGALRPAAAAVRLRRAGAARTSPAAEALAHLAARRRGPAAADRHGRDLRGIDAALARLRPDFAAAEDYFDPPPQEAPPSVSLLCPIHRPEDASNLLSRIAAQTHPRLEVVVAVDGGAVDPDRLSRALARLGRPARVLGPEAGRRGAPAALNRALAAATGEYALRFDADDAYLPGYVARTVAFMRRRGAEICARSHVLMRFDAFDCAALLSRTGEGYTPRPPRGWGCPGATLAFRRETGLSLGFDEALRLAEDADFLCRAQGRGLSFVAAPPWDFVARRGGEAAGHTWATFDALLLGRAERLVATGPARGLESALARLGRTAPQRRPRRRQ